MITREKYENQKHYGENVWVSLDIEKLRKTDCLCLSCDFLGGKCPIAEHFYNYCIEYNLALAVTRCPNWRQKNDNPRKI